MASFHENKKAFTEIYDKIKWFGGWNDKIRETKSGSGSTIQYTQNCVKFINDLVEKEKIRTVLDLGCGEMNWQKLLKPVERYLGVDIVDTVIQCNRERFKDKPYIQFECADITTFPVENWDLVICRETLFHLPTENTVSILENIKKGGNRFFITSSHPGRVNKSIQPGQFYEINIQSSPFNFGQPLASVPETLRKGRYLCLYKL